MGEAVSKLTYNGIEISLLRTNSISHEPVRAEDGSYWHTRVTISVTGLVNGPPITSQSDPGPIATPTNTLGNPISKTMQAIRHALLQERGSLVYSVGDSPDAMIVAPESDDNGNIMPCDAANGPIPLSLVINRVDGTKTFHVSYAIACHLFECPGSNGSDPSALICSRYAQQHDVDSNHYTTITTRGQALFRTDLLEVTQKNADTYRAILLPPVPRGFRRVGIAIVATPSRNALTFTCTDREMPFDLGDTGPNGTNSNITDVKATYEVSSTGANGGGPVSFMTLHRVSVQVWGNKAASNWRLTQFAYRLASAKLPIGDPSRGFLRQISVMQSLTERFVALNVAVQLTPADDTLIPGLDVQELRVDQTFSPQNGMNPSMPGRDGTAGTYTNEILVARWASACAGPQNQYEGATSSDGNDTDYSNDTGPIVEVTTSDDLPEAPAGHYSPGQTQYAYTDYTIESKYETRTNVVQAPLAGPVKIASPGESTGGGGSSGGGGSPGTTGGGGSSPGDPQPEAEAEEPTEPTGGGGSEAEDPTDSVFLTLARPLMRKIVVWSAERINKVPDIPNSTPIDPNLVLIDEGHVTMAEPTLLADSVSVAFRISGRYIYGLKRNLKSNEPVTFSAPPWQNYAYGQLTLEPTSFVDGIIDGIVETGSTEG